MSVFTCEVNVYNTNQVYSVLPPCRKIINLIRPLQLKLAAKSLQIKAFTSYKVNRVSNQTLTGTEQKNKICLIWTGNELINIKFSEPEPECSFKMFHAVRISSLTSSNHALTVSLKCTGWRDRRVWRNRHDWRDRIDW